MERVYLKFAYVGDSFHGMQVQSGLSTVEGELLRVLKDLGIIKSKKSNNVRILSRTDKGVSAAFNIIGLDPEKRFSVGLINNRLKGSVWVLAKSRPLDAAVKPDPVSRKSRINFKKRYRYLLFGNHDFVKIRECLSLFSGTHDFSSFSRRDRTKRKSPVRTIDVKVVKDTGIDDDLIVIDICGKGFLWQMVRRIIQCAVDYEDGKITLDKVRLLLECRDTYNFRAIDAKNLMLLDVDSDIVFEEDDRRVISAIRCLKEDLIRQAVLFGSIGKL